MARRFFRIRGRLIDAAGDPKTGVRLSIVDDDRFSPDLIATGWPRADGTFSVSFAREAFNQDPFERDAVPKLLLVVSRPRDRGEFVVVHEERIAPRPFDDELEDLGTIVVDERASGATAQLADLVRVRRVRLDAEAIDHAMAEVAPLVEDLLGVAGLRSGLDVRVSPDIAATGRAIEASVGEPRSRPSWVADAAADVLGVATCALYDPFANVIHLNLDASSRMGLDVLKMTLAHELVHVAQFRTHKALAPALLTATRILRRAREPAPAGDPADVLGAFAFFANLEGYAYHVEADWLRSVYCCAEPIARAEIPKTLLFAAAGVIQEIVRKIVPGARDLDATDELALLLACGPDDLVAAQHLCGRSHYGEHRRGDRPAEFDPDAIEQFARALPGAVKSICSQTRA